MKHARFPAKAAVVLSALIAASAAAEPSSPTPARRPATQPTARGTSSHRSPRDARAALQTIYYYAYRPDKPAPTGKFKPYELESAIRILNADQTEAGVERKHLAIAKLVGATRLVKDAHGQIRLQPRDLSAAIQQLAGPAFAPILAELAKLPRSANRLEKEDAALDVLAKVNSADLQRAIWPVAFTTASHKSATCGTVTRCDDPKIDQNGVVQLFFQITVHRPFSQVKRALDPQAWDTCNSTFFEKVYAAKQSPAGNVPVTPCAAGGPVTVDEAGDAEEDLHPPPLGAEPSPFVLFEHFQVDNALGGALFKNLLCITPSITASKFQFNYDLIRSIKSRIGENDLTDGGILVDRGFVRVDDEDGESNVTATKFIKFADSDFNRFTSLIIGGMCREVAGQQPGSGACCTPSGP